MRALWRAGSGSILKLKFSRSASTWATALWRLSGSGQSAGRDPRQGHRLQVLGHHQHHRRPLAEIRQRSEKVTLLWNQKTNHQPHEDSHDTREKRIYH